MEITNGKINIEKFFDFSNYKKIYIPKKDIDKKISFDLLQIQ